MRNVMANAFRTVDDWHKQEPFCDVGVFYLFFPHMLQFFLFFSKFVCSIRNKRKHDIALSWKGSLQQHESIGTKRLRFADVQAGCHDCRKARRA